MEATKYPPLTTAALVNYSHLGPFSEVVPAEKMHHLEHLLRELYRNASEAYDTYDLAECQEGEFWHCLETVRNTIGE